MYISSLNPYNNYQNSGRISFGGRIDKTIALVKNSDNLRHIKITPEITASIYKILGYEVGFKKGSHVHIIAPDGFEFTYVLPHNGEKYICPFDVKRLKYAILGNLDALRLM